jgi:hypothetical protein
LEPTVPPGATIDFRITVTARLVPAPTNKLTELERRIIPMHEQLGAGLREPNI